MSRRTLLLLLIIGALVAAAVIAVVLIVDRGEQTSTSRPLPSERFAGWWFSDGPGPLHIVRQDGHFRSAGTVVKKGESNDFVVRGETLLLVAPDAGFRSVLRLSSDAKSMTAAHFAEGKRVGTWRYHRGTTAEIADYHDQMNMSWLAARVMAWLEAHGAYPPKSAVRPDGALARETTQPWPTNPYAGKPMTPGRQPGHYVYTFSDRGFSIKHFSPTGGGQSTYDKPTPTPAPTAGT